MIGISGPPGSAPSGSRSAKSRNSRDYSKGPAVTRFIGSKQSESPSDRMNAVTADLPDTLSDRCFLLLRELAVGVCG